jgi:hypothetical protein
LTRSSGSSVPAASSSPSAAPRWARLAGRADLRRWFERFRRLLPDPSFDVQRLVIGGPVWHQRIAAHVIIRSRVAGEPYQNQFAQFLTLRWARSPRI